MGVAWGTASKCELFGNDGTHGTDFFPLDSL